jgi:DNA-binding response OmpR family regulator
MRVKAMFRRIEMDTQTKEETIAFADITIHMDQLTAYCKGNRLGLTNTEFNLLAYLLANKEKAVSRNELLNRIWGFGNIVETRATDATVKRLRRKLSDMDSEVFIETVWGYGFRIRSGSEA